MRNERYSFSWAKLRFALYMICVFRHPSRAIFNISASMNSRSLRLLALSKLLSLSNSVLYLLSIVKGNRDT